MAKASTVSGPTEDGDGWSDPVERIIGEWRKERPEADVSPLRIIARIVRLETLIGPHLDGALAGEGLNAGLFDVLAALRRGGAPYRSTPTELAKLTMLTTGGITGRIDRLERAGLVAREPDPLDRRVMYVRLTPAGVGAVERALDALLEAERQLISGLSATRAKRLAADLSALERAIARPASRPSD